MEWLFLLELSLVVLIIYINTTFIFLKCLFYELLTLVTDFATVGKYFDQLATPWVVRGDHRKVGEMYPSDCTVTATCAP